MTMLRLILIVLFVAGFLAIKFLPWWVTLICGIILILFSKFFAWRFFLWLFSLPFRAKGKVLRNAGVEVHSIHPAAPPPREPFETQRQGSTGTLDSDGEEDHLDEVDSDDDLDAESDVPRDYYEIEVTITPKRSTGPFYFWEFGEVTLVRPGKRWYEDDESCHVVSVDLVRAPSIVQTRPKPNSFEDDLELARDDDADDDAGSKIAGPHRVKMLIGVQQGVRELVFNYYFENFGSLRLP